MKKKYAIIIVTILIAILCFFVSKSSKHKANFVTKKLERCTIVQIVEASGTINPVNTVSVGSTVSGLIKEIYVDSIPKLKKDKF